MKRLLLLASAIWLTCAAAFAAPGDIKVSGTVVDEQGEPIIGASVAVPGTTIGTATDIDGNFTLNAPKGKDLQISYIGYKTIEVAPAAQMGKIVLDVEAQMLKDVVIEQSAVKTRLTPVAVSTIGAQTLDIKLGNQELPEVLKTTPGVWTTKAGGGFGDAKTNVRGFKSENVAVMINGVPTNDMEWGGTYWSNWAGIADVTANIQVQRGLGASIVSTPSVGGTINITTRTIDVERGGSVWYGMGNDGLNNYGVKLSTGLMKNGWAVTVLGSRRWGDGYVQGTPFNSYTYFVNVSKRINEQHQLSLTAFGGIQDHIRRPNQRSGLSIMGYQDYGRQYMGEEDMYRYNPTYGYDNYGNIKTSNRNKSHKPMISLNHIWKIDDTSSLSSAVYVSLCNAGGYSGQGSGLEMDGTTYTYNDWYGASDGVLNMTYRRPDGTFNYGAIYDINQKSTKGSMLAMSSGVNKHQWYGLVSSYKKEWIQGNNNKINLTAGIDMRYYASQHYNELVDLYGGDYFIDYSTRKGISADLNPKAADPMWRYEKLGLGDYVYRHYNGYAAQEGVYAQGEYSIMDNKFNFVLSGSVNNTAYWRRELMYADNARSKTVNFWGYTIKGGANYNIDKINNVFFNVGLISRVPFFQQGAFTNYRTSNAINKNAVNEKCFSAEVGYGIHTPKFAMTLNAYFTQWFDKTMTKSGTMATIDDSKKIPGAIYGDGNYYVVNMSGVDARHMGVELDFNYVPFRWLNIEGMASVGNWRWTSKATGYVVNELGQPLANTNGQLAGVNTLDPSVTYPQLKAEIDQKNVKVGDSPQLQASIGASFIPFKGARIGADWVMEALCYSDYSLSGADMAINGVTKIADPWRIPWGQQLDMHASYKFKIGNINATLYGNVYNLFNNRYITDAMTSNRSNGTWENAYGVFYSFGRTYSIRMKINF